MQLRHLTDDTLDRDLIQLVKSEREVLIAILHHLREVEARRLFSQHGYPSLFDYATKRLGYSEDQACRRISAMRLMKDLPQIENSIEDGRLTLTHLSKAQSVFRKEKKARCERTKEQKLDLLLHLEQSSMKETQRTLEREAFVEIKPAARVEVTLEAFPVALREKLQRLLDVRAHANPELDVVGLIELLADLGLAKWDKMEKAKRAVVRADDAAGPALIRVDAGEINASKDLGAVDPMDSHGVDSRRKSRQAARRSYVPAAVRHAVFIKSGGVCVRCGSGQFLEIDHIEPVALGGSDAIANLRMLCRTCNQRAAIERFGIEKMSSFIRSAAIEYVA